MGVVMAGAAMAEAGGVGAKTGQNHGRIVKSQDKYTRARFAVLRTCNGMDSSSNGPPAQEKSRRETPGGSQTARENEAWTRVYRVPAVGRTAVSCRTG